MYYESGPVKPIFPKPIGLASTPKVESLSPQFTWKPVPGVTAYDFAIWKAFYQEGQPRSGELIHMEKGIAGTSYRVPITLSPGEIYAWSVRATGTRTWSCVRVRGEAAGVTMDDIDPFIFKTPE